MTKKEIESLYIKQKEKCTNENAEKILFSNGLTLENYYIDKEFGAICFINKKGVEMEWLIEDEVFADFCKQYLINKEVKVK